jgi:hypothetical protein
MKSTFAPITFAAHAFRSATLAGLPGRGVAYYVAAGQAGVAGTTAGQPYHTGASAGLSHG